MNLKNSLAVVLLLAIGAGRMQAQAQDLNTEYKDALATFNDGGPEAALPKFASLVDNRWDEMSPIGKHGALTLRVVCELGLGRGDDARRHGAWFYEELPEAFSSLAGFSASDTPGAEVAELRASIHVLSLVTAKGSSLLYLHNASDKPIEIAETEYDVSYGYETASSSVGNIRARGSAFVQALHLPAGGGAILQSPSDSKAAATPDWMAIVACATRDRLPGWFHVTRGDYTQILRRVHITADVKWGDDELKQVALAWYDDLTYSGEEEASSPGDINAEYRDAIATFSADGVEAALPKFASLVDNRWDEMSPIGKHGSMTFRMVCELGVGRPDDARKHGAWLHEELPGAFSSLADFSASDRPGPEVAELRASIHLLSLLTAKGESLLYMHNASDKPLEITDTEYDVSYGYETASSSVGDMTSSGSVAFKNALQLPAGGGAILRSVTGTGLLSVALPDCVAVITCATKDRLPGWQHLSMGDYTQTLRRVHITANVKWGDRELKQVPLAWYDAPTGTAEKGAAPPQDGGTEQD